MYRYCVDNAVTYTSEDFVLFRESPFACWMERLTLENPDHGILPDADSKPPGNFMEPQDDLGYTLRAEGKNVHTVDWDAAEPARRKDTLQAMRLGVDFIVNGQLAVGPLSGSANLLMRTSGYSELGNYLYIPCDTQAKTTLHSAFRLCFLADLLHSLQGQLPPQMLIIRSGSDLLPLQTEDHIYHYRAVKQRFMNAMRTFRKHRMPDPAESSHFGRWSDCAHEVLKQRALRDEESLQSLAEPMPQDEPIPQEESVPLAVAAMPPAPEPSSTTADSVPPDTVAAERKQPRWMGSRGLTVSGTLADQARMLRSGKSPVQPRPAEGLADAALNNLEFIGRSSTARPAISPASAPPPDSVEVSPPEPVDRDEVLPTLVPPPVLPTDSPEFEVDCIDDSDYRLPADPPPGPVLQGACTPESERRPAENALPPFSSSLNTSGADRD